MIDFLPMTFAERRLPPWLRPDEGDTLYGIQAIADWLALPFLDVRTMIELDRLPTGKEGRSHVARRTALAEHILALERDSLPSEQIAAPPADARPNDALGLLSGQDAIAIYLGCSHSGVRHRRDRLGLRLFWIGKTPFARKASLDRWRAGQGGATRSTRRLGTIRRAQVAATPTGWLVGAAAIAAHLGRTVRGTRTSISRDELPVTRVGRAVVADPDLLAPYVRKEAGHG